MKTSDISSYLSFLHSCYLADNRQLRLSDFLNSRKVEHLQIFNDPEELINGFSPKLALPDEYAQEVSKIAEIYQKEKELLYGSLFLLGSERILGKTRKVCAPLLLFPATIQFEKGHSFVYIQGENCRLNSGALSLLGRGMDSAAAEEDVLNSLPQFPFDYGEVGNVARLLKKHFPGLDTEAVLMYPELWPEKKIKQQLQPKKRAEIPFFKLVPASGLGIVTKSADTYGILSELEELGNAQDYSRALHTVFGEGNFSNSRNTTPPSLPTVLNKAQQRAVINARSETLSLVVGPPGTGKSYTIACMALDHLMRGESVLISSKQDEAVDVVAHKIAELMGREDIMIRGGAKRNYYKITKRLRKLLHQSAPRTGSMQRSLKGSFQRLLTDIAELENKLSARLLLELSWSEHLLGDSPGNKFRSAVIKTFHSWYTPHWKLLQELQQKLEHRVSSSREITYANYNDGLHMLLQKNRKTLADLYEGLRSASSSEREKSFGDVDYDVLLRAFPIWLCRLADLYRILPQQKELFDLVIIDEASQCDMATSMAAIQRAKRVVVCGDPNQLRHVSFLSKSKMVQLLQKAGLNKDNLNHLNFRETSLLDLISRQLNSQNQVSFLDEHYRSVPEIIRFSNREFYSGSLRVMNERPIRSEGLGGFEVRVNGKRNEKGINEAEALEVLRRVQEIIAGENELEPALKSSVGILSPFRDQADYISRLISAELDIQNIRDHRISIGTAYGFQGEERDVMFLSFAVDMDSHHSAFGHINKPDVFNVSITRAKGRQYILHSVEPKDMALDHYLRMLLEDISNDHTHLPAEEELSHDIFMQEVQGFLGRANLKSWIYFSIAGVAIDILVKTTTGIKGIDLIGYPGHYQDSLTVERFKILGRAGVPVFPPGYSFWTFRRRTCEEELSRFLLE